MNTPLIERVLDTLNLSADQRAAALERTRDVFVTAGAGSGKTSTLVGRYAGLLADGCSPRRVLAITFTKKAAREMRSRVRKSLSELAQMAQSEDERQRWLELGAQMDSARIGTIHSLCTEMLLAHPAEAGIDPRFTVLDEGLAAAYKLQAVQDSLKSLVEQPEYELLLSSLKPADLQKLLEELLQVRLEARESLLAAPDHRTLIADILRQRLANPALAQPIAYLRELSETRLRQDAGDKLADMVGILLSLWAQAQAALQAGAAPQCAELLYQARRTNMKGNLGTRGMVKETVSALKEAYDRLLNPLTGGAVDTAKLVTNQWQHVAVTYNGATVRFYINGVLDANQPAATLRFGVVNEPLTIGADLPGGDEFFKGTIRSARVYGRALSGREILAIQNEPPILATVSNAVIVAGQNLIITSTATDPNVPPQTLNYSLLSAPSGASLNPTNGLLTWRPVIAQAPSTNPITLRVADNGSPSLSATQSFFVTVLRPHSPTFSGAAVSNGLFFMLIGGDAGLDYVVETRTNMANSSAWIPTSTNFSAMPPYRWTDPNPTELGQKFYRVRLVP